MRTSSFAMMGAVLVGCGGGSGGGDDPDPLLIVSTSPAEGDTGVEPTTPIEVTFDQELDPDALGPSAQKTPAARSAATAQL